MECYHLFIGIRYGLARSDPINANAYCTSNSANCKFSQFYDFLQLLVSRQICRNRLSAKAVKRRPRRENDQSPAARADRIILNRIILQIRHLRFSSNEKSKGKISLTTEDVQSAISLPTRLQNWRSIF
jgi:hypothetical protein